MDKKKCKYCKSDIDKQASYCTHCSHYQNWRRFFKASNSTLALFIALITVLTSTLPILNKMFEKEKTSLTFSFLESTDGNFDILVTNEGNKRGIIGSVKLKLSISKKNDQYEELSLTLGSNPRIIEPNAAFKINLSPPTNTSFDPFKYLLGHFYTNGHLVQDYGDVSKNTLLINTINHTGEATNFELPIPKQEFLKWLASIYPKRNEPDFWMRLQRNN
ncbi:hypothetical protein [uncultured Kordia sp.]|uniref:hypothetical protein n=1 Tax=uncultured Kordia sp. TaxID=507699 RepID=UPI0026346842|nr:hypothetical protein [uncultured Kordia sp.]